MHQQSDWADLEVYGVASGGIIMVLLLPSGIYSGSILMDSLWT